MTLNRLNGLLDSRCLINLLADVGQAIYFRNITHKYLHELFYQFVKFDRFYRIQKTSLFFFYICLFLLYSMERYYFYNSPKY